MPLQATSGAASYDAFGGGVPVVPQYIEDVFSTYLYTGTGALGLNIPNGINLLGKGGMVWAKGRTPVDNHHIWDTSRGVSNALFPNLTSASSLSGNTGVTAFNSNGFTLGTSRSNTNAEAYASWTFREQPKFFDVVTYTGTGANRTIAHNLGSVPACIIVKRTDTTGDWQVYHRSLANTEYLVLNSTAAKATGATRWNSTTPTSTVFSVGTDATVNASSGTYVAYIFAHDAGGFGLAGTDNVISCGSYTGNGSATGPTVTLGYEPQWLLIKRSAAPSGSGTAGWVLGDNMRGLGQTSDGVLSADNANAEVVSIFVQATATGFQIATTNPNWNISGDTYIYIAIRRGPMKVPTSGTSVYTAGFATATTPWFDAGFPVDMAIYTERSGISDRYNSSRLLQGKYLLTNSTATEASASTLAQYDFQEGYYNNSGVSTDRLSWMFRRAPSFFDEVCYTGTGSATTFTHNLGVVPELMIVKGRSGATAWQVYASALANTEYVVLNTTAAKATGATRWNSTTPTTSVFSIGTATEVNTSAATYVAYLFSTCAGVSKVGSYTGTGTTLQVNCGFTAGARFVLIKRTDSTGDWYVWDTARGIIAGNDPYLLLNSTAAEVTSTDYIDTYSAGFELSSTAPAAINASGGTYIFLAIA
jgi:hypothetical protein